MTIYLTDELVYEGFFERLCARALSPVESREDRLRLRTLAVAVDHQYNRALQLLFHESTRVAKILEQIPAVAAQHPEDPLWARVVMLLDEARAEFAPCEDSSRSRL